MLESPALTTLTRRQLLSRTWHLCIYSGMMHTFASLEASVFLPYLYTRVRCCDEGSDSLSNHYDVKSPHLVAKILEEVKASGLADPALLPGDDGTQVIPACQVPRFMPQSELWSFSPHCVNKAFVQDQAQGLVGTASGLQKLFSLAVMPLGGTLADAHGRRPVLMVYTICCFLGCCTFLFDASAGGSWGSFIVVFGLLLWVGQWDPKDTVISAAVADIVGSHEGNKVRSLAFLFSFHIIGGFSGIVLGFCCLRLHLDDYTKPFVFLTMVSVVLMVFLHLVVPETLRCSVQHPSGRSVMNPLPSMNEALQIICQDRVLLGMGVGAFLFSLYFVGFLFIMASYLLSVGFSVEELLLPRMLAIGLEFIVCQVFIPVLPKVRLWNVLIWAHLVFFFSYLFWGPWIILVGHSGAYLGHNIGSFAMPLLIPSVQTIISQRVPKEHQAKCQAAIFTCGTLGMVVGAPLYSKVLFDGTATGMMRALPALVSALLALVSSVLAYLLSTIANEASTETTAGVEMHGRKLEGPPF